MSLINQVLNDLDARTVPENGQGQDTAQTPSVVIEEERDYVRLAVWGLVLVVGVVYLIFMFSPQTADDEFGAVAVAVQPINPVQPSRPVPAVTPLPTPVAAVAAPPQAPVQILPRRAVPWPARGSTPGPSARSSMSFESANLPPRFAHLASIWRSIAFGHSPLAYALQSADGTDPLPRPFYRQQRHSAQLAMTLPGLAS